MKTGAVSIGFGAFVLAVTASHAENAKPEARDVATIQNCLKSQRGKELQGERCIGVVADPCLQRAHSTADSTACADRENLVWDAMLNGAYQNLGDSLDEEQKTKARDMQRSWIESREKTCAFYWDYFQGTMASPMSAYCVARETARRAMFLQKFVDDSKGQ